MRLLDAALYYGVLDETWRTAVLFDASEIMDLVSKAHRRGMWTSTEWTDYGSCPPPFTSRPFWVEATFRHDNAYVYEPDEYDEPPVLFRGTKMSIGAACYAFEVPKESSYHDLRYRWMMQVLLITAVKSKNWLPATKIPVKLMAFVNHEGMVVGVNSDEPPEMAAKTIEHFIFPMVLMTLSQLNKRTEVTHVTPSVRESRRALRQMKAKPDKKFRLRDYYLLRVTKHKNETASVEGVTVERSGETSKRRHHSVRGHFRRVPESGLFGRGAKGKVKPGDLLWIPDHVRGDRSLGVIEKGYIVGVDDE